MKGIKLTTQLVVLFTLVTIFTSLMFAFALERVFNEFRVEQNHEQLDAYYKEILESDEHVDSEHNGYIIYENGSLDHYNMHLIGEHYTAKEVIEELEVWPGDFKEKLINGETYYFKVYRDQDRLLVVFTGETYLQSIGTSFNMLIRLGFIALVLLGNGIILVWSRLTVERVTRLKCQVLNLSRSDYRDRIDISGSDEITELAQAIEKMRQEIAAAERIKQEMLQNISHDFKTPIAVIQSYAEAITDGISEPDEADVIIKQADVLNHKVRQLLELSKLEYLKDPKEFEPVRIKDVILNIVNNQKYRNDIEFQVDLDDSIYYGIQENFYSAFNNIVDNALRYARTKIVIRLKNKRLTFFNDGEPISQKFIDRVFRPYEKGEQGQFGLGMSIVQKTMAHFNLTLSVENTDDGVLFTIEPL
ncbi:MAG: histidine kinase dimerization/phospho-acceptor domain-containing protein [Acholeplasmataceae bacterium]